MPRCILCSEEVVNPLKDHKETCIYSLYFEAIRHINKLSLACDVFLDSVEDDPRAAHFFDLRVLARVKEENSMAKVFVRDKGK